MADVKRKAISKTMRFEVFKRDSFKCQYCGRSAPDVILEVDHIKPVAEGGGNGLYNLITSCRDCNRGKGKRALQDNAEILKQKDELDVLNKRREQMEMLLEWREELLRFNDRQVNLIEKILFPDCNFHLNAHGRTKIKALLEQFSFEEVCNACNIAACQYFMPYERIHKIGGICYNRKRGVNAWESKE